MPTFGTYAADYLGGGALPSVAASIGVFRKDACGIHEGAPVVEATVFCTVAGIVHVAGTLCGCYVVVVIQVFGHPGLFAYGYRLVNLAVASIG